MEEDEYTDGFFSTDSEVDGWSNSDDEGEYNQTIHDDHHTAG